MPNSGYDDEDNERERIFYPIKNSESFDYKTRLVVKLPNDELSIENVKIAVPLTNIRNFMFNLDFLMINSETELILK